MLFARNYKTAVTTFIVALTTGFAMQNGYALASEFAKAEVGSKPVRDELIKTAQTELVAQSVLPDQPKMPELKNRTEQGYTPPKFTQDQELSALGLACDVTFTTTKSVGAMVALDFKAPCSPNETVTVHHQGLAFTTTTSDEGHFSTSVPAMVEAAKFDVTLINGETVSSVANVPEIENFERVALQWTGDSGLRIHALEMGADYGERGHVWAKSPQSVARALQVRGGYITVLGGLDFPAAKHIEVYSFPSGQMQETGVVRLSVEAEVTANTCNKEITAQAMQASGDGGVSIVDLTLFMPACDTVGDFLVLNNILRDLKIAQN